MPEAPWPPGDPATLDPVETALPAGVELFRVHFEELDADRFNPHYGAGGRFHFIRPAGKAERNVPALYAAEGVEAALAESVFHDVPIRPKEGRRLAFHKLEKQALSSIRTGRVLRLVELHHPGIARLQLEPRDLTDTDPSEYPRTRAWAQALHDTGDPEGLVWRSRLYNEQKAYTLFGDRVASDDFDVTAGPVPLGRGRGLELVYELAERLGITIVHG